MSTPVRHVLGISGGKDSAALAIYLKNKYPDLEIDFYTCDTKCELTETEELVDKLRSYLGNITTLIAAQGSPEPTPFDHFLKTSGGYLPSVQAGVYYNSDRKKLQEVLEIFFEVFSYFFD